MEQMQRRADTGDAPASAQDQQSRRGPDKDQQQPRPQEPSSLNPAAARLLREAIVSQPAPVTGSSDILAFARSVDRADTPLESDPLAFLVLSACLPLLHFLSFFPHLVLYLNRNKKVNSLCLSFLPRQFVGHFGLER
ncbi:uncharacterized protein LOC120653471 [Panicum virgatum]|uniref:Uncharacterized protein n=1 Tax=Panicum virgatum TaxID=38727 RepID=A0A8T0WWU5_PANVG|nr:uncharacterized protein LOC120653471 [Panicum virgatum]KAG2650807.1 hypothetical protein PVAP13_1NG167900 [Panicum virgatum]